MIVVCNTSPIMNLAVVEKLDLIRLLCGKALIPEAVRQELLVISPDRFGAQGIQRLTWLETQCVTNRSLVDSLMLELDAGEAEAIALATEIKADLLLLDERQGRKVAHRLGLKCIGLLGLLVEAKRKGFISAVKPALDRMITEAGFWVGPQLYARVLQETKE